MSAESFAELRSSVEQTVTTSRGVILDLEKRVVQEGFEFNMTALNERFVETVNNAQKQFEDIFAPGEKKPEDKEEADRLRREAASRALDCVEHLFVNALGELWGLPEGESRERVRPIRMRVEHAVGVVGESRLGFTSRLYSCLTLTHVEFRFLGHFVAEVLLGGSHCQGELVIIASAHCRAKMNMAFFFLLLPFLY